MLRFGVRSLGWSSLQTPEEVTSCLCRGKAMAFGQRMIVFSFCWPGASCSSDFFGDGGRRGFDPLLNVVLDSE